MKRVSKLQGRRGNQVWNISGALVGYLLLDAKDTVTVEIAKITALLSLHNVGRDSQYIT